MPRMQKRPIVEPIRRKCAAPGCSKVRLVVYKEWKIPKVEKEQFVSHAGNRGSRSDIPGAVVKNYCCFPEADVHFCCTN